MAKEKNNCNNCACAVGDNYCTRQKDMQKAMFSQCDGWSKKDKPVGSIKISEEKESVRDLRQERIDAKFALDDNFSNFIQKGGHYSFRTNSFVVNKE